VGELPNRLPDLGALVAWLRPLYDDWGYLLVGAGAYLEHTILLGLFFPGGTMVLLGAFYSRLGTLAWPLVLLLATVGTAAGVLTDYLIGRLGLYRILKRTWLGRRITPHLPRARRFLARHGAWAVLLAHFAGQARSALALTAGTTGFPVGRYALYEIAGAIAYNLLYCLLGYYLADNLDRLERIVHRIGAGAWLIVAALVVLWLVRHRYQRLAKPTTE
jgi:membrane protein DedA with SNARE-associated domain